jgi:glycosyltransferase involved in cell wall biosynthesis
MTQKLKVVWICHFSNQEIRDMIPLSKMTIFSYIKRIIGRGKFVYTDFAPWVNNLIKEFENFEDVELHIIAPHSGLKCKTFETKLNGLHYHFFQHDYPFPFDKITYKLYRKKKEKFYRNRKFVKQFIRKIKPDIINLVGTENPYYSITALDIKNIPVYVSAQTVYTNPLRKTYSNSCLQLNWDIELKIHKKEQYYGCQGRMHHDLILKNNPKAIIFKMLFPIEVPKNVNIMPNQFDFVFFAGISKQKGIEDLIEALSMVKEVNHDVSLNIVGGCSDSYMNLLLDKIHDLKLSKNIVFNSYFPLHSDMHQHIVQSRYAVLPVKLDVIPGSIIEAILLDLPVVTYKTSGTPYLNREKESVLISDIGDIQGLATNMLRLLKDENFAKSIARNAKQYVLETFNNANSAKRLLADYKAVINNYHNNTTIPKELLFDLDEFPRY